MSKILYCAYPSTFAPIHKPSWELPGGGGLPVGQERSRHRTSLALEDMLIVLTADTMIDDSRATHRHWRQRAGVPIFIGGVDSNNRGSAWACSGSRAFSGIMGATGLTATSMDIASARLSVLISGRPKPCSIGECEDIADIGGSRDTNRAPGTTGS